MKLLFEVPRNTPICLHGKAYLFEHIDGAYSLCKDTEGRIVHLSAMTPVSIIQDEENYLLDLQYSCEDCGVQWESMDTCACNDECPVCGKEMVPLTTGIKEVHD